MVAVNSGRLYCLIGSSRSGKTQKCKQITAGQKRMMIWDPKGEYPARYRARNCRQLVALMKKLSGKPGIVAMTSDRMEDFEFFCKCAQTWVKSHYLVGAESILIFEETADVTSPGKAPPAYGTILRRFLSYGVTIFAITQRPAESDKTAVGNASIIHICRLQRHGDRRSAARDAGLPEDLVASLRADQDKKIFDYVTVDTGRGFYHQGQLSFPRGRPKWTNQAEKPL